MDPKIAKTIANSEGGRHFIEYLAHTIHLLDSVDGIEGGAEIMAIEVRGRQRAIEKLRKILSALVTSKDYEEVRQPNNEYAIDVDMD